ncbi:YfhE family protein [Gottfriedia solisilvae]
MDKRKQDKTKKYLSATQEVLYAKEFKRADRAAGYKYNGIGK